MQQIFISKHLFGNIVSLSKNEAVGYSIQQHQQTDWTLQSSPRMLVARMDGEMASRSVYGQREQMEIPFHVLRRSLKVSQKQASYEIYALRYEICTSARLVTQIYKFFSLRQRNKCKTGKSYASLCTFLLLHYPIGFN